MPRRKKKIIRSELTFEQEITLTHTAPSLASIVKLQKQIQQLQKNLKKRRKQK